jgi:hypothetical protein
MLQAFGDKARDGVGKFLSSSFPILPQQKSFHDEETIQYAPFRSVLYGVLMIEQPSDLSSFLISRVWLHFDPGTSRLTKIPSGSTEIGMARLSLSDADKQVRDWFQTTAEGLGCNVSVDEMGNQFAVRPGHSSAAATFAGSHLDTQPSVGFTYIDTATDPDSSSGRPL